MTELMIPRRAFSKMMVLIVFCLVSTLIALVFLQCRVQAQRFPRTSHIKIKDLSGDIAEILFIFEEETTSTDFRLRSTNWLVIKQYDKDMAIPIGRADPDWILVGTNNVTKWHWKLEKIFYLQHQTNGNPFFIFPHEVFTISFHIATNETRSFVATIDLPNFDVGIHQEEVDYSQSSMPFQFQGCPHLLKLDLSIFHNLQYRFIIWMLYIIITFTIATAFLLAYRRNSIHRSDFFRISSSLLIFLPVLFFTFRNSIAPEYLTLFDVLCFVGTIIHGFLLLWKIALSKTS